MNLSREINPSVRAWAYYNRYKSACRAVKSGKAWLKFAPLVSGLAGGSGIGVCVLKQWDSQLPVVASYAIGAVVASFAVGAAAAWSGKLRARLTYARLQAIKNEDPSIGYFIAAQLRRDGKQFEATQLLTVLGYPEILNFHA